MGPSLEGDSGLSNHACAKKGNFIYVTGGWSGVDSYKWTLRYDILNNSWERLNDMNLARRDHSMVLLDGALHVFGGVSGSNNEFQNTAEKLDENGNWKTISSPVTDQFSAGFAGVFKP